MGLSVYKIEYEYKAGSLSVDFIEEFLNNGFWSEEANDYYIDLEELVAKFQALPKEKQEIYKEEYERLKEVIQKEDNQELSFVIF